MSKISFTQNVFESMKRKNYAIKQVNYEEFLRRDEYFELALCLSYMTLSKEKIIKKEIKNDDRLGRLTEVVDSKEIDKVFDPSFNSEMPVIYEAMESNNIWILDNIRDSIMHGEFDVDEERKLFLINNNYADRKLIADIPFSWFIAYAKNDIMNKRITDKYTIQGFFYNIRKANYHKLNTEKELNDSILYHVYVSGANFNIKEVEKKVKEMFFQCAHSNYAIHLEEASNFEKGKYEHHYLSTFYFAKEVVKNYIESEFPGVTVSISINNRKARFINQTTKKLNKTYNNYSLMIDSFNQEIALKSVSLLENISSIIENIKDGNEEIVKYFYTIDDLKKFNDLLNNECKYYSDKYDIKVLYTRTYNLLRSIFINVCGLTTLVTNYDDLCNGPIKDDNPDDYGISGFSKGLYVKYATERRKIQMQLVDLEIKLFQKQSQLQECPDNVKSKLENSVNKLLAKKVSLEGDLDNLASELKYIPVTRDYNNNQKVVRGIDNLMNAYYKKLSDAKTVEEKRECRKVLSRLSLLRISEESKYTYGKCTNMKDILTIARNSLAHIGRVKVAITDNLENIIYLHDYDTDNTKSGEVVCGYGNFLDLIEHISKTDDEKLTREK